MWPLRKSSGPLPAISTVDLPSHDCEMFGTATRRGSHGVEATPGRLRAIDDLANFDSGLTAPQIRSLVERIVPVFAIDERAPFCCQSQRVCDIQYARAFSGHGKARPLSVGQRVFPISVECQYARTAHLDNLA